MIETYVIGHLGQDCRVGEVNGKKVINFSLAHTHKYKDQSGQAIEKTLWIDCSYWSANTKIAEYLKKGQLLFVRGVPTVSTYKNQQGITMAQFRLRVEHIQLLGGKRDERNHIDNNQAESFNTSGDDLPF